MRIGIIGQGFVGTAVREGLKKYHTIRTYDLDETKRNCNSIEELVDKSTVLFVCLPTPMNKDGSCNTDIVEGMVMELDNLALIRQCSNRIVVIKSTIPPGTTERLNEECKHIQVIFNPEFLTEANFIEDFKTQDRIIIGGPRPASTRVRQLFYKAFPKAHIIKTSSTIAEMVKYMTNTFLATKVSFANEIFEICERLGIDYDKVTEYATYDERLGKSHWSVPGPDGHYGFGGSCFPKDINALISVAKNKLDLYPNTLIGAWETNLEVRPEEDWRELKGRAVVDD
jgi:UDPglucose 6-dehydrogenase